jgi:hypothetical protein
MQIGNVFPVGISHLSTPFYLATSPNIPNPQCSQPVTRLNDRRSLPFLLRIAARPMQCDIVTVVDGCFTRVRRAKGEALYR